MLQNYILDHIGIAVSNIDKAIEKYTSDFGFILDSRETLVEREVELAFLQLPNTKIELLTPAGNTGAIYKFLQNHGEGMHHICYEVQNIRAELQRVESLGYRLIDKEPRPGAHGTEIAFIHPKSMSGNVLTELCEYV